MNAFVPCALALALAGEPAAKPSTADWVPLVQAKEFAKARALCEGWLASGDDAAKAEGHKCLANVELGAHGEHATRLGGDAGGGFVGAGYDEEPALRALEHLDAAVRLAPGDLSIHQGRLHVLVLAAMYDRMVSALEESDRLYGGKDGLDAWIAVSADLFNRRALKAAEGFLLALEKRHPGDHRIAGNLSAVYAMLQRDPEALAWARKAVKAAPDDPIDNWNLGRILDYMGRVAEADPAYRKALGLMSGDQRAKSGCLYADFVANKKKQRRKACEVQQQYDCEQWACVE
jgi:tetratricopeptide (TPR) repeat protein